MYYALVASADRRRELRKPSAMTAIASRIVGGEEGERFEVEITDTTRNGLGIRAPIPLEDGGRYRVQLWGTDACCVRVIRSRQRYDGQYDIGARFI